MDFSKAAADAATGAAGGIALGPFGMLAGALISAVPDLIGAFAPHLAGPQSEQISQAVVQVVAAVTKTPSPAPADVAGLPPEQKLTLQVQLAQIASQAEAARLAAANQAQSLELARIQAQIADTAGARGLTTSLATIHSSLAWGSAVVSVLVLLLLSVLLILLFYVPLPAAVQPVLLVLVGSVTAMATQVGNYWLGNSSGSDAKDHAIANSVPASLMAPAAVTRPLAPAAR